MRRGGSVFSIFLLHLPPVIPAGSQQESSELLALLQTHRNTSFFCFPLIMLGAPMLSVLFSKSYVKGATLTFTSSLLSEGNTHSVDSVGGIAQDGLQAYCCGRKEKHLHN